MKKALPVAGVLLMMSTSPAWPQDSGVYLGASSGQVEYRGGCADRAVSCDEKDGGLRGFGGYQFNRHVAVELGYADLGGPRSTVATGGSYPVYVITEVTAWDLSALGSFSLRDRLFAYGRAGIY